MSDNDDKRFRWNVGRLFFSVMALFLWVPFAFRNERITREGAKLRKSNTTIPISQEHDEEVSVVRVPINRSPMDPTGTNKPKKAREEIDPSTEVFEETKYINRFIVVPEHKLLFCFMEKISCSMFSHLFRMVRLLHPSMKDNIDEAMYQAEKTWDRNPPEHHNMTVANVTDIFFHDDTWTRAIFYREPVGRFLSAFRSKCGGADQDGGMHCKQAFGPDVTGDTVEDLRLALDQMEGPKKTKTKKNRHFAPMASFCGGLGNTLDYYDFVHELSHKTSPKLIRDLLLHVGVDADDTEQLVENVVKTGATNLTWETQVVKERLGIDLRRSSTNRPQHNTDHGVNTTKKYFSGSNVDLRERIEKQYEVDIDLFFTPAN